MNGEINPKYTDVYAFDNDFAALLPEKTVYTERPSFDSKIDKLALKGNIDADLFKIKPERGVSRVICFSPLHDLTIPEMAVADIRKVVDLWCSEYTTLGAISYINHVQIFSKGVF